MVRIWRKKRKKWVFFCVFVGCCCWSFPLFFGVRSCVLTITPFLALLRLVQGTPVNIIVGSQVWVEDPEDAWIDGEVTQINGKNVTIITTNGKTVSLLLDHEIGLMKLLSFIGETLGIKCLSLDQKLFLYLIVKSTSSTSFFLLKLTSLRIIIWLYSDTS